MSEPTIWDFAIGDLGPARRHLLRIQDGTLKSSPAVLDEISRSIERCVGRLEKAKADATPSV